MTIFDPTAPHPPAPPVSPGPYMVDVSIVLPTGGAITLAGRGLDRHGLSELFALVQHAVEDVDT